MNKQITLIASLIALFSVAVSLLALPIVGGGVRDWWIASTKRKFAFEDPALLYIAAEEHYNAGNFGMAHDIANRAVIVDPKYTPAHKLLAAIFIKEKRYREAEAACRKVMQIDPNDHTARIALGTSLASQGKASEAQSILESVKEDRAATLQQQAEAQDRLQSLPIPKKTAP